MEKAMGFPRDPFNIHQSKLGIDATAPLNQWEEFERKIVPGADRQRDDANRVQLAVAGHTGDNNIRHTRRHRYMIGIGFELPEIKAWASTEIVQVIANKTVQFTGKVPTSGAPG
jgi:hypothetical protein